MTLTEAQAKLREWLAAGPTTEPPLDAIALIAGARCGTCRRSMAYTDDRVECHRLDLFPKLDWHCASWEAQP
jgi:hypothetical protein